MTREYKKTTFSRHKRGLTAVLLGLWCLVTATGFGFVFVYDQTPGQVAEPQPLTKVDLHWSSPAPFRLVMGMHPMCPCTRASVDELQRLLLDSQGAIECQVLSFEPASNPEKFRDAKLNRQVELLPNTTLVPDPDGEMAAQLGMHTSGAVVLYDRWGTPMFYGGVTGSRGHVGLSPGGKALLDMVQGSSPATRRTPIYGCPIQEKCETNCTMPLAEGRG